MTNPADIPKDVYVWDHFPEFKRKIELHSIYEHQWVEEGQCPDTKQIDIMVRFVMFMCSDKSPFFEETDYPTRRDACLHAVGLRPTSVLGQMIINHHWWYLKVVRAYMMQYASKQFAQWIASRIALFDMFEVLMRPNIGDSSDAKSAVKAKADALKTIEELSKQVDAMEAQLFPMSDLADMAFREQLFDMEHTSEAYAQKWDGFD